MTYERPAFANKKVECKATVTDLVDGGRTVVVSVQLSQDEKVCSKGIFWFSLVSVEKMEKILGCKLPHDLAEKLQNIPVIGNSSKL